MRQNALTPVALRKVPAIFCCTLAQRRSRSAWLLVNGIERSSSKASTCSARASSASRRFLAGLCSILPRRRQAVVETPELLPILRQAGVVDSGGQGYCTILEGIWRYIRGEASMVAPPGGPTGVIAPPATAPAQEPAVMKGRVKIEEEYGYEVVFLLKGEKLDVETIRQTIIDMGGVSTVVAGDDRMLKVHTHTEWPGKILDYGVSLGSLPVHQRAVLPPRNRSRQRRPAPLCLYHFGGVRFGRSTEKLDL